MTTRKRLTKIAVSLALVAMGLVFTPPFSSAQTVAPAPAAKPKTASKTPARATSSTTKKKAYSASTARARRAQLARARAAARARELRDLQTPRFTVDEFGREVPDVRAEAAIIFNPETGEILWENHAKDQRSIASITKVMTALVFLESGAPLDQMVTVQRSDVSRASTTYLRNGFKLTAEDLLNLLLVGSDNAAARALARISPMGYDGFIESMNNRAKHLGLESTVYADPSGLLAENMSSAYDQARLIATAASNETVGAIMRKSSYTMNVGKPPDHRQQHQPDRPQRRHRRRRRQDRFHQPLGLLPGHAAAPAAVGPAGGVRGARRQEQRQPFLGNASLVQLDEHADQGVTGRRFPAAARAERKISSSSS